MALSMYLGPALLALTSVVLSGATLTADYQFNGDLNDSVSNGITITPYGGTTVAGSYLFGAGQGLSLTNILANGADYSIGIRFEFDNTTGWRKLVDFKDRTSDSGQYVNGNLSFYSFHSAGTSLSPNTFYDVFLTRTSAGMYSTYVNGTLAWSQLDTNNLAVFSGANMFFFMDDLVTGSENSGGTANRIVIYDGALSASDVASINLANESSSVPEPSTMAMAGLALVTLAIHRRRRS